MLFKPTRVVLTNFGDVSFGTIPWQTFAYRCLFRNKSNTTALLRNCEEWILV